jgi:general secretion pathway protein N
VSSALAPLDRVGSYRLVISGGSDDGKDAGDGARVALQTLQGPLQLSGSGQWAGPLFRFRGEARAEPDGAVALTNLLTLLGPRRGDVTLLTIG